jgi:hypothetical protein
MGIIHGSRGGRFTPQDNKPGWGDSLAALLKTSGLAKLAPKGCGGCKRRQEKLNRLGRKIAQLRKIEKEPEQ